jgi:hypothetical protein
VEWLQAGDPNTSFFQARATTRRRANKIKYLLREYGSKCDNQTKIKRMAQAYYKDMFNSDPHVDANKVLESISIRIDQTTNEALCKPYTNEEIRGALFQMGSTKAPGPDGLPAMFYQKHWKILEKDICNAVRAFMGGEEIPEGLCDTIIILIPKVSRPDKLIEKRGASWLSKRSKKWYLGTSYLSFTLCGPHYFLYKS